MPKHKSVFWIVLSKLFGFLIFFILLYAANFLLDMTLNPTYHQIVQFMNANIVLVVTFSLILMLGEIVDNFAFPFNLPAPFVNAIGSVYVVAFVFNIFELIEQVTLIEIYGFIYSLKFIISPLVFILVLIGGYISIFTRLAKEEEKMAKKKPKKKEKSPSWEDVGDEFRHMIYDVLGNIRDAVKPKKKK